MLHNNYTLNEDDNENYGQKLVSLFKNKINNLAPNPNLIQQQNSVEQSPFIFETRKQPEGFSTALNTDPKPESVMHKIGGFLFGNKQSQPEFDEYGIQKPQSQSRGFLSKAMPYVLSTMFGGLPAGLLAGYAINSGRDRNENKTDIERYLKEKEIAEKQRYGDRKNDLALGNLSLKMENQGNLNEYRSAMADSARVRAQAANRNSFKPGRSESDTERFIRLKNIVSSKGAQALTPGDAEWLHSKTTKMNKTKNQVTDSMPDFSQIK